MTIVLPEVDGYQLRHFPTDPWQQPIAYVCDVCGCYVANTEKHTNECQLVTAEPIPEAEDAPTEWTGHAATPPDLVCQVCHLHIEPYADFNRRVYWAH